MIDLNATEARAKAATPGPWIMDAEEQTVRAVEADGQPIMCDRSTETWAEDNNANDCEFIAHSREDIPALLAEVKRQADEIKTLSDFIEAYTDICDKHQETHHKLMDKIETVTAERDEAIKFISQQCHNGTSCKNDRTGRDGRCINSTTGTCYGCQSYEWRGAGKEQKHG